MIYNPALIYLNYNIKLSIITGKIAIILQHSSWWGRINQYSYNYVYILRKIEIVFRALIKIFSYNFLMMSKRDRLNHWNYGHHFLSWYIKFITELENRVHVGKFGKFIAELENRVHCTCSNVQTRLTWDTMVVYVLRTSIAWCRLDLISCM